jgi:hypothetical protein
MMVGLGYWLGCCPGCAAHLARGNEGKGSGRDRGDGSTAGLPVTQSLSKVTVAGAQSGARTVTVIVPGPVGRTIAIARPS